MKGYVYIISNPAMPGIFKIGFTRKNPELRAKEFDSTGVPHPYVVEYEILVDEPHALEQRVHKSLRAQREGKEWFRCSFTQAVQGIRACYQSVFGNFSFYSYKKACGQKKTVRGSKNSRRLSNGTPAI